MGKITKLLLILLITCVTLTSCSSGNMVLLSSFNAGLKVHYIDVGRGDCIFIQNGDMTMLIDTGLKKAKSDVMDYLKSQGLQRLDYLILTHQHADHIGNAAKIIEKYRVEKIYMPKVSSTSKRFKKMTKAVADSGLNITTPVSGSSFDFGDAKCTFMAPNSSKYDEENDYSIVLKMIYKNTSFLFTGDAQSLSENEMINKGYDLSADVLKLGQHGSATSTSEQFLDKVKPKYAVLSCLKNYCTDHPSKETMQKLKAKGIKVYRTDESGTIVCTSDGYNVSFDKAPGDYNHGTKEKKYKTGKTNKTSKKNKDNDNK